MRIGFYLENRNIPSVDLRYPERGNPGCGGTQFLFAALPFYLQKYYGERCLPIIIADSIDGLPTDILCYQASGLVDAALKATQLKCDFFVYRPRRDETENFFSFIENLGMKAIAWAHVTPTEKHLRAMSKCKAIEALVCVGGEQYDHLRDSPVCSKLALVPNGFDVSPILVDMPMKDSNLIVYMGALVPQKGFGLLARTWKDILRQVPQAKLSVIGSGKLYNSNAIFGKLGIASQQYESEVIIPNLCDSEANVLPSVTFHGKMGVEKYAILQRASIGVPNPTGATETFCLSAVEMSACRIAIVSGGYNGILDTVKNLHTGLLGSSERDLINNVTYLLRNPRLAREFGDAGYLYVAKNFNFSRITSLWIEMFERLLSGEKPVTYRFKSNIFSNYKWLVIINTLFQLTLGKLLQWPSVNEVKRLVLNLMKRLKGVQR